MKSPEFARPAVHCAARLICDESARLHNFAADNISHAQWLQQHPVFSEVISSSKAAGFAEAGKGCHLAQDGALGLKGSLPILTMGGLKARGNPWGATGVYQAVEATLQLRCQAGDNQIPGAKWGMVQCLGGPASTAITNIFERIG